MFKWVLRILAAICLAVLIFSGVQIYRTQKEYQKGVDAYTEAVEEFVMPVSAPETQKGEPLRYAPVRVDFEALHKVNPDVVGWIYCENTAINYPVLQGEDNETYLHKTYDGVSCTSGSIFVEAANSRDFADYNTIIYGHHMRNGSMFRALEYWEEQDYYEEHPVMWLLTPEQDYRIDLFSGYATAADSDTYTLFKETSPLLEEYNRKAAEKSDFKTDVDVSKGEKYVVLSTCAYYFENARYVVHGMLVPVEHDRMGSEFLNQ